jgi:hypothetical protein
MGISQSKNTETINWNNVKTDDMSSTLPNFNNISNEAKQLITKLNLPEISDTNSEFDASFIFNKNNELEGGSDHGEENNTSPFITSEMYNYIINKYNNTNEMIGGGVDDESSSTSSTSSSALSNSESSDSETEEKKPKKEKKTKKVGPVHELSSPEKKETFEGKRKRKTNKKTKSYKGSENYLSYISSSAHTDEYKSVRNENNYSISSVNTSDINMISDN